MNAVFVALVAVLRGVAVIVSVALLVLAPIAAVHAMPKPQATSSSSTKKQDKAKAAAEGKQKAAARKEKTGRDHQGNHDSLTKSTKKGAKGDKHMNGVTQSGSAGKGKKK